LSKSNFTISKTNSKMAGRGSSRRDDNGWGEWGGYMAVSFS
jgi:hypothetical protein